MRRSRSTAKLAMEFLVITLLPFIKSTLSSVLLCRTSRFTPDRIYNIVFYQKDFRPLKKWMWIIYTFATLRRLILWLFEANMSHVLDTFSQGEHLLIEITTIENQSKYSLNNTQSYNSQNNKENSCCIIISLVGHLFLICIGGIVHV